MLIGFDAKKIVKNLTGIGNYSRGIVDALSHYYPENKYLLYTPVSPLLSPISRMLAGYTFVEPPKGAIGELWRIGGCVSDIRRRGVDLFHGLSNELPFGIERAGCRTVVTIHDLIFLRLPHTYSFSAREILKLKTRYACRHADAIIAISEMTRQDLIYYYNVPPEKIHLIYQGCDSAFSRKVPADEIARMREQYSLPQRYLLSVATFQPRKNFEACIRAMKMVTADVKLVLAGRPTPHLDTLKKLAADLGLEDRVIFLPDFPQAQLPALMQGADVFLYMSRFEGFGIPVLEAMTCGVPVIAATGSCLEEVAGDAGIYCHPDDIENLSGGINVLLTSPEEKQARIKQGLERLPLFAPEYIADRLMDVYSLMP